MADQEQFTPVHVVPPMSVPLGFTYMKPAGWTEVPLPPDPPTFDDPKYVHPLAICMAPYGAVLFTVAARPAYEDGTVMEWCLWLCREQGLNLETVKDAQVGPYPVVALTALQPSEMGQMRVRGMFFEDGQRLFVVFTTSPDQIWKSVESQFENMLTTFRLDDVQGPTRPVRPGQTSTEEKAVEAKAPEQKPSEAKAPEEKPSQEKPSEDEKPAAAKPPAADDRPTLAAEVALAEDASSLDQDHPMNARLLNSGAGFVPKVLDVRESEKFAVLAAVAIEASFRVPFGWHVLDDSKRTLIFDAGGKIQISINLRHREGKNDDELLDELLSQYSDQPQVEHAKFMAGKLPCVLIKNLQIDGETLHQTFLLKSSKTPGKVIVTRVTAADEEQMRFALNTAEVVLTHMKELRHERPQPTQANERPQWAAEAERLESEGKHEEAEKLILNSVQDIGALSSAAYVWEKEFDKCIRERNNADAMRAFERAKELLTQYAASATSGGEGAALSRERDERIAAMEKKLMA